MTTTTTSAPVRWINRSRQTSTRARPSIRSASADETDPIIAIGRELDFVHSEIHRIMAEGKKLPGGLTPENLANEAEMGAAIDRQGALLTVLASCPARSIAELTAKVRHARRDCSEDLPSELADLTTIGWKLIFSLFDDIERLAAGAPAGGPGLAAVMDPVVAAYLRYMAARSAFDKSPEEENMPEFQQALAALNESRQAFIGAPVTSPAGAALKLHWLIEETAEGHAIDIAESDGFHRPALDSVFRFLVVGPGSPSAAAS